MSSSGSYDEGGSSPEAGALSDPHEALELEGYLRNNPRDLLARYRLIQYYSTTPAGHQAVLESGEPLFGHLRWCILERPSTMETGEAMFFINWCREHPLHGLTGEWNASIAAHPDDSAVLGNAAVYFEAMGADDRAMELLRRARSLSPKESKWSTLIGHHLARQVQMVPDSERQAKYAEALVEFERSLEVATSVKGVHAAPVLVDLARTAFLAGRWKDAESYARRMISVQWKEELPWFAGDFIFIGNLVLGHLALRDRNVVAATDYLLGAGRTPGSGVLASFGPSMSLASELLTFGMKETVLEFLELCSAFWKKRHLETWREQIRAGVPPRFGDKLKL